MVKKGSTRSAKFSAKHDPYVIMLRIKALQNVMKQKFQIPAQQNYYIDINVKEWIDSLGLPFGKAGTLLDLTKQYVWKIANMSDFEIENMHQTFISKGFTEDQYNEWLINIEAKATEIVTLYSFCHRETSKMFLRVDVSLPIGAEMIEGNYSIWTLQWAVSMDTWSSYFSSVMAISISEENNIIVLQDFYSGSTAKCKLSDGSFINEDETMSTSNLFTPQTVSLSRYVVGLFKDVADNHRLLKIWKDGELKQTTDLSEVAGFSVSGSNYMLHIAITKDGKYIVCTDYSTNMIALFKGS
jgi:hypothetical protein